MDLGVSSLQLDEAERGFSYAQRRAARHADGPDDAADGGRRAQHLRRARARPRSCATYGEERFAPRIARAIVAARARGAAEPHGRARRPSCAPAIPAAARTTGGNPAKRTFQALRIEVNGELEALERALPAAIECLAVGGRIVVLAYHSLEDRLVKRALAAGATSSAPAGPARRAGDPPAVPAPAHPRRRGGRRRRARRATRGRSPSGSAPPSASARPPTTCAPRTAGGGPHERAHSRAVRDAAPRRAPPRPAPGPARPRAPAAARRPRAGAGPHPGAVRRSLCMASSAAALLAALLLNTSMAARRVRAVRRCPDPSSPGSTQAQQELPAELDAGALADAARRGRRARSAWCPTNGTGYLRLADGSVQGAPASPAGSRRDDAPARVGRATRGARDRAGPSSGAPAQPRRRGTTVPPGSGRPAAPAHGRRAPAAATRGAPAAGRLRVAAGLRAVAMAFLAALVVVALAVFGGAPRLRPGARAAPAIADGGARRPRLDVDHRCSADRGEITDANGRRRWRPPSSGTTSPSTSRAGRRLHGHANPAVAGRRRRRRRSCSRPLLDMNAAELGGDARRRPPVRVHRARACCPRSAREVRDARASTASTSTGSPSGSTRTARSPGNVSASSTPTASGSPGLEARSTTRLTGTAGQRDLRARAPAARRSPAGTREDTPATPGDSRAAHARCPTCSGRRSRRSTRRSPRPGADSGVARS